MIATPFEAFESPLDVLLDHIGKICGGDISRIFKYCPFKYAEVIDFSAETIGLFLPAVFGMYALVQHFTIVLFLGRLSASV